MTVGQVRAGRDVDVPMVQGRVYRELRPEMKRKRRHGGDMSRAGRARARQGAVTSNGSVDGVAWAMSGRHAR
jgi:hypothetical protein